MTTEKRRTTSLRTVGTFIARGTCSQALLCVLGRAFDHPMRREERASDPLAGGIAQHGYQCGMIWGSALAAGAEAHRRLGPGPSAEAAAVRAARRIVDSFRAQNDATDCVDITGMDASSSPMQLTAYFLLRGGTIDCFRRAARWAPVALREVEAALSEGEAETPTAPVSCAALLARRMGASDLHATMAAGLAGGIGLSGGGCGALGAAIWIAAMDDVAQGRKLGLRTRSVTETIDRFVRCTDDEFECTAIAGRRFESVADHARHLSGGGCSRLLDALAAGRTSCAARDPGAAPEG